MKRGSWKVILGILIVVILIIAIYFTFFFSYKCEDMTCFRSHQEKCSRTRFTYDTEDATWFYKIKGKDGGKCEVAVKILLVKQGTVEKKKLEGNSMNCYLEIGSIVNPDSDISQCHGILKEQLQELIIQKLHSYIVDNLGEIGTEINSGAEIIKGSSGNVTNSSA